MENEDYVPVRERQFKRFEKRLDEVLKQYSVVKVGDATGAIHGKDYREMKQIILDTLFEDRDY